MATNAWVIPTPQPLSVMSVLEIDAIQSVMIGLLVSLVCTVAAVIFTKAYLGTRKASYFVYNSERGTKVNPGSAVGCTSFARSLVPILVPTVLIMVSSFFGMSSGKQSAAAKVFTFLGDKNVAVFLGMGTSYILLGKYIDKDEKNRLITESLKIAGPIILITAAGGTLAKMVQTAGVGDVLVNMFEATHMPVILSVFLVTALTQFATGSGSVSAMLAASITLPLIQAGMIHPLVAFAVIGSGTHLRCHVNSSFFWIFSELFGTDTKTTLKTLCLTRNAVISFAGLGVSALLSLFL